MAVQDLPGGIVHLMTASVVAFLGLYHLALYRSRRELFDHLWIAPLAAAAAGFILLRSPLKTFYSIDPLRQNQMECLLTFAAAALFFQFLMPLFPKRIKELLRGYQIMQIVLIVVVTIFPEYAVKPAFSIWWNVISFPFGAMAFFTIARQALFGYPDARIMGAGMVILFITFVLSTMSNQRIIRLPDLLPFGAAIQIFCLSLALLSRVPRLYKEFDTLRDNLERRVRERTQELSERTRQLVDANTRLTDRSQELTVTNQKLTVRTNDLAEANLAKSRFLANMSHELRTPLNAIIGYSEMIVEESEEDGIEAHPDLTKINSAGKHLLSIISEILDLSKIEAGKMELSLEIFNLGELIGEVVATIKPIMEKNSNAFELRKSSFLGQMHADSMKVRQVLLNLLSNAAKFTDRGLVTLDVKRETVDGIETIFFKVTDSGIGITPEQLKKLFQAFQQADSSTTKKFGGTGLGLVISQKFCQMMGGDITVTSQFGVGSNFTVRLPANVLDPHTDPIAARTQA